MPSIGLMLHKDLQVHGHKSDSTCGSSWHGMQNIHGSKHACSDTVRCFDSEQHAWSGVLAWSATLTPFLYCLLS